MLIMNRLFSIMLFLILLSNVCWAGGNKEKDVKPTPQVQQQQVQPAQPSASKYWTGDGGKGISLAILAPKATGLAENQNYLPALVQGEFVSNFTGYSAISVLDRQSLDNQYAELFSGYYDDNAEGIYDLGKLAPTNYIMGGNITRTATGYALQMQITRTEDKMTTASYSGTFTFAELDNLTGIRRSSLELLQKMGVTLTALAQGELTKAETGNRVNAQTALARGITAQRQGTEVAALSYFFQAAAFEPSLVEAVNRSSILAANISSGNIGEDVRNDIQWRRDWVTRLTETEQYFDNFNKTQSMPYTLFYKSEIKQGVINYQNETVNLSIETILRCNTNLPSSITKALQTIYNGLEATKRKDVWGLGNWPRQGVTNLKPFERRSKNFAVVVELLNSQNKVISRQTIQVGGYWELTLDSKPIDYRISADDKKTVNFNVNANDITDNLTIRIASVNGIDIQTATQSGVLQIISLPADKFNFFNDCIINRNGEIVYKGKDKTIILDTIWDEPIITINRFVIENKGDVSTLIIGDNVRTIGNEAFANNRLRNVIIGNNVTVIGNRAFINNWLEKITIGNNVKTIGDEAFSGTAPRFTGHPAPGESYTQVSGRGNSLTQVVIPNSVQKIGERAFALNLLTSISIPDNVISIGKEAFFHNPIRTIIIGNGVTSIIDLFNTCDVRYINNNKDIQNFPNTSSSDTIVSVTIGSNVLVPTVETIRNSNRNNLGEWRFATEFGDFYNRNKNKAGIYTYEHGSWRYRPQ